jgi:hypothetical protein
MELAKSFSSGFETCKDHPLFVLYLPTDNSVDPSNEGNTALKHNNQALQDILNQNAFQLVR